MLIHMRQPFFSITTGGIFALLGLLFGLASGTNSLVFGGVAIGSSASWALTGLMFVMAYFSLVHLKYN